MCISRWGCTCKSNEYAKVRFAPDTTVEQRWKWSTYIGNMLATTAASRRSNLGLDLQSKNSHKTRFWNSGVSQHVWWFDQKGMLRQIRYGVVPQCPLFCINSGDVMRGGEGGGTEHETGNVLRGARLKAETGGFIFLFLINTTFLPIIIPSCQVIKHNFPAPSLSIQCSACPNIVEHYFLAFHLPLT